MFKNKLKMVALTVHGTGSKVFQSFFDGHEEIMMIPGYQLMYFYPHWIEWKKKGKAISWSTLCDALFENHPSIFDTRIMPGSETLDKLGKDQNEWIEIDKFYFKKVLVNYLKDKVINSKNFLIGIHYAYCYCKGEDISKKKIIFYHIHYGPYVSKYLIKDFPDLKIITLIRDLRACLYNSIENAYLKSDRRKLNESDFILLRNRAFKNTHKHYSEQLDCFYLINIKNIKVIKHEDLLTRFEEAISRTTDFINIKNSDSLKVSTFGSKLWKTSYYNIPNNKSINSNVNNDSWKKTLKKIDWFVLEGLHYDFFIKYYKKTYLYNRDSFSNRIKLIFFILFISKIELNEVTLLLKNFFTFFIAVKKEAYREKKLIIYEKDAYYKYKWYNINYKLFKDSFFIKFIKKNTYKKNFIIIIIYFFYKTLKYSMSIFLFMFEIFLRIMINYNLFLKRVLIKKRVLPELL